MKANSNKFNLRFLLALVLFVVGTGVLGFMIFKMALPEHYFKAYPLIPFCFFFFGMAFLAIIQKAERSGGHATKGVLMLKVIKIAAATGIILLYYALAKVQIKEFAITFLVFYVLYLFFETVALAKYEQYRRKRYLQENK